MRLLCWAGRTGVSVLTRCDLWKGQSDVALAIMDEGYKAKIAGAGLQELVARRQTQVRQIGQQTLIAGVLTLPVFIVEMGGRMFPALHHWISGNDRTNQQLACAIYSYHACNDLAGGIITLILVVRFLEARAKGRTGEAIALLVV